MKVPLLNFLGGPGAPLLNFEGGLGVPLLNFRGVPESWSHFYTMPRVDPILQISQILNFSAKCNLHEIKQKFSIREIQSAWNMSQIVIREI